MARTLGIVVAERDVRRSLSGYSRYSGCRERREKEFVRIRVHGQHGEHARLGVLHLWASRWNSGWTG